jgi:hypothetical protein
MKIGTQIAYIPLHAGGDISHPDVEFGFITASGQSNHFCRYWRRGKNGLELRTVANSESTPTEQLIVYQSVSQSIVDDWLVFLEYTKPFKISKTQQ